MESIGEGPVRSVAATIDEAYFQSVLAKPLHEIYRHLEPHLRPPGVAIDLGCGVGTASLFLLQKGFEVYAIDKEVRALEILASRLEKDAPIHLTEADMTTLDLPIADVIVAGFSLFFLDQAQLESFWPKLVSALKPGGLFAGQFLGKNDEWANQGHALVDAKLLASMLEPFEPVHYEEVDREGQTALGNAKHWHVFHVVARKR